MILTKRKLMKYALNKNYKRESYNNIKKLEKESH